MRRIPPPEFRGRTRATARPVPAGHPVENDPPPGGWIWHLGVSSSGPRARSWRHGRACRAQPSSPRPRTASDHRGVARYGRPRSPASRGPAPRRRHTADGARGRRPEPDASGDRSPGAPRSAAAGPARALLPPRSWLPADGARAASRATATPQKQTRRGYARRTSTYTIRDCPETTCCDGRRQALYMWAEPCARGAPPTPASRSGSPGSVPRARVGRPSPGESPAH
jgi:hypothetical protein